MQSPAATFPPQERLLSLKEVLSLLGISKTTWYHGIRDGFFPAPIKLGTKTARYRLSDIQRIIQEGADKPLPRPVRLPGDLSEIEG